MAFVHIKNIITKQAYGSGGGGGSLADCIELFLVPANTPRLMYQRPWHVLSCLWDGAYKSIFAAYRNKTLLRN